MNPTPTEPQNPDQPEVGCPRASKLGGSLAIDMPGALATMGVVGINHRKCHVAMRSHFALTEEEREQLLKQLIERGVKGAFFLSTCNRAELYFSGSSTDNILSFLMGHVEAEAAKAQEFVYAHSGIYAVKHLFRVASGIDSSVLGETEILAQLKSAKEESSAAGTLDSLLDTIFQRSLSASKRVRSETLLCKGVTSIGALAVREATHVTQDWLNAKTVVVGAGQTGQRIVKELYHKSTGEVLVLNRSKAKAEELAAGYGFGFGILSDLSPALESADVVFSAVSHFQPFTAEVLQPILERRKGRLLTIVDISMPPSYTEDILPLEGLRVIDLDGLRIRCDENSQQRESAIPDAERVVEEEIVKYEAELRKRRAAPTIAALSTHAEEIRAKNLAWFMAKYPGLEGNELRMLEDLSRRMVKGFMEMPLQSLKEECSDVQSQAVVQRLFRLEVADH